MFSPVNDEELLEKFVSCTLEYEDWTHRAHVRIGYLFVKNHGFEKALPMVGAGIQSLNASFRRPEGPVTGYHETTTHAFLHLIAATINVYGEKAAYENSDAFCDAHPQLMNGKVLRFFYSPERRMDPRAKFEFLSPDLTELPRLSRE